MRLNNNRDKKSEGIHYQTANGFRNIGKAYSALGIDLENIVKAEKLPELERLQKIKLGYDPATSSFYQDAVINGKKVRRPISDETFFAFAQKYTQQYGVKKAEPIAEPSQASADIISMDDAYTGTAKKVPDSSPHYLGKIAAAGLVALALNFSDVGCRSRRNIRRPSVPLTNAQIAGLKADEYAAKPIIDFPKLPLGYSGTPVKNSDGTTETVQLPDLAKIIMYTGDDLPTDEAILNSNLSIKYDTEGKPVSATYLNANNEMKEVNPLALKLAYIINAQALQADNNGVALTRSLSIARYLIVFNQLVDGIIDISKGNRELHAGDPSLPSLGMRYQDAGKNGLLDRLLRLGYGTDDHTVPSFTYNAKFFNKEASDYFRNNIAKPAFEKVFSDLLDRLKISSDSLDKYGRAARDNANPQLNR
ncbi:hypothetical protein HYU06_07140 [Candidatus Woesearchaeota archaeon]|nr:hypothetical protein [Candidatus Woesearchaeota archaeon]